MGGQGRYDVITADFSKAWNKSPLQVCHVIPSSIGGNEKPSNLVLMCRECHDLAPNTTIPEIMYLWMNKQDHLKRMRIKVEMAINDFDLAFERPENLLSVMNSSEFKTWALKNSGLHWPQSGYSGLGHNVTISTFFGLLKYYLEN